MLAMSNARDCSSKCYNLTLFLERTYPSQSEIAAITASGAATGAGATTERNVSSALALGEGGTRRDNPLGTIAAAGARSLLITLIY